MCNPYFFEMYSTLIAARDAVRGAEAPDDVVETAYEIGRLDGAIEALEELYANEFPTETIFALWQSARERSRQKE